MNNNIFDDDNDDYITRIVQKVEIEFSQRTSFLVELIKMQTKRDNYKS